jgi:hypothetical protein
VSEVIADVFEPEAFNQKMAGAGMPERMGAVTQALDVKSGQATAHDMV